MLAHLRGASVKNTKKNSENAMRKPPMDDCGAKKAVSIPEEQIRPCRDKRNAVGHACPPQLEHPAHYGGCFLVDHQPVPVLLALAVAVGGVGGDILTVAHFGMKNGFHLVGEVFQMVIWKIMSSPSTER